MKTELEALKAAARATFKFEMAPHRYTGKQKRDDWEKFHRLADPAAVIALADRLEAAEAVAMAVDYRGSQGVFLHETVVDALENWKRVGAKDHRRLLFDDTDHMGGGGTTRCSCGGEWPCPGVKHE